MNKPRENSIRRKITNRVIRAMVITVLVLSLANLTHATIQMRDSQNKALSMATDLTAKDINTWVIQLEGITTDIANTLEALNTVNEKTVKMVINKIADEHPELLYVYVATEDGHMYMARGVGFAAGVDARQRGWYVKTKEAGTTTVIDPYISATTPDIMMATVATPIFFRNKFVGVVAVDAEISVINDYVNSLNYENGAYGFLIDSDGCIISHPNEEYMPNIKQMTNAKEVMPELADLIDNPGTKLVTAKDYSGDRMVYATQKLEACDWVVGMAFPKANLNKSLDRVIRICLIVAIICILLFAGDMKAAITKILKPIDKINPAIDSIMNGNFRTMLDISTEDDELGMLQDKLSGMIASVSLMIQQQQYVLGELEKGNLTVEDCPEFPGDLNDISIAINSIKETLNDIVSDIQFSAINLQSFAMGINETSDLNEMRMVFEELSAEANILMEKTSKFITIEK